MDETHRIRSAIADYLSRKVRAMASGELKSQRKRLRAIGKLFIGGLTSYQSRELTLIDARIRLNKSWNRG